MDVLIGADFNCRQHLQWDPTADPNQGVSFCDKLIDSGLACLNDGSFTRLAQSNQADAAIDLTLATPRLAIDASWSTGDDERQSDHLPISISINKIPSKMEERTDNHYNCAKADWA